MIAPFQMAAGPRVRFGRGEATFTGEEAKALGIKRPMVLTDPGVAASGSLDPIISGLQNSGLEYFLYNEVEADPSDESMTRAKEAYEANGCDGLIAAGGGSSIDTANHYELGMRDWENIREYGNCFIES